MTREQLIAHLELHGWFVVEGSVVYLAHEDGRWITGRTAHSLAKTGGDHSGKLRAYARAPWELLDDTKLEQLVEIGRVEGWL